MKVIAFIKKNPQYKNFRHPIEDSFKYNFSREASIVAVADGITRDPIGIKELPDLKDKEKIKEAAKNYPRPSPAKKAADLFCKSIINYMKKSLSNDNTIKKGFEYANNKIKKLNEKYNPKPDYLENDFWACVGSAGLIKNGELYWGFIADCGVCVFNKKGKLKFNTENEGPNSEGSIDKDIAKKFNIGFRFSEGRRIIRSQYRNNPSNHLSYGALTGEKKAMNYVRIGKFKLQEGDYILFYSDGLRHFLSSKKFNITKKFNELEKFVNKNADKINGGEGTLVAIKLAF